MSGLLIYGANGYTLTTDACLRAVHRRGTRRRRG